MTVYYYFYNATIEQSNTLPILGFGQSTSVAKLNNYDESKIREIFDSVIMSNFWGPEDLILALPDDASPCISYTNKTVMYMTSPTVSN